MSDIFHEVEQDLRREQLRRLWDRFGLWIIGAAVLVVAVTAGWRGYVAWKEAEARDGGDRYFAALAPAATGDSAAVADAMAQLSQEGAAGYRLLAAFRSASERARSGDTAAAVAAFEAIAADGALPGLYRDLARVRAAYLLIDGGDPAAVAAEVGGLADGTGPWRQAAREALGLAAYAAGDTAEAKRRFDEIVGDAGGSAEFANRARMMLALMMSDETAAAAPAEDGATATPAAASPAEPAPAAAAGTAPAGTVPATSTPDAPAAGETAGDEGAATQEAPR